MATTKPGFNLTRQMFPFLIRHGLRPFLLPVNGMKVAKLVQQVSSERACLHVSLTLKFGKSPAAMPGQIRAAWNMCPKKRRLCHGDGAAMSHHLRVVVVLLVLLLVLLHLGAPQLGSPSEAQHAVLGSASMPSSMQRSGGVTPKRSLHTP